jgi:hypothetical protein
MPTNSCNTSSLAIYVPSADKPWNIHRVNHLYRRVGFGASLPEINIALGYTPEALVDLIVDQAMDLPIGVAPTWANWNYNDYINNGLEFDEETFNNHDEMRIKFVKDLLSDGLRGRLTLFWHNHFVTELQTYFCSNYLYHYYTLLQTQCLGDFKEFVRAIGLNEAMLMYLNGFENTAADPNENYARELYELFTLGVDNGYTQTDIVETARALTGYNHINTYCDSVIFGTSTFDSSEKTILGRTGNWGYDDVIDILFEERGPLIANFICTKLYKYFVSPEVNQDIIDDLASEFVLDFDLAKMLRRLFKSEHFFDDKAFGTLIKSPYDLTHNYMKTTNFTINPDDFGAIFYYNLLAGQELFNPVDVAGWQGDKSWINSSTLGGRWQALENFIWYTWNNYREELRDFALDTSDHSTDPAFITKSIIDRFVPNALHTEADYLIATDVFKGDIPQNYYDDGSWNLNWDTAPYQVVLLLLHITKIPEFQLK